MLKVLIRGACRAVTSSLCCGLVHMLGCCGVSSCRLLVGRQRCVASLCGRLHTLLYALGLVWTLRQTLAAGNPLEG